MGDTQKSQTISTANQGIASQVARKPRKCSGEAAEEKPPVLVGASSLIRIKMLAEANPDLVFRSLAHRIDISLLGKSFRQLRKNESTGVDKITAKKYAENLDENLYKLHQRLQRGQYVASPVKRIWVDKEDGKKRPIGIPALEDKIVQKAVTTILGIVYEPLFHDFSHGFRSGHSQHMAVHEIREKCRNLDINWILSADITGLFDNIDHHLLRETIRLRVNDGGIIRLIGKWLNAGVAEGGEIVYPEKGTPQGGVISPVLSNIFLHYVLDDWYVKEVQPRMKGKCFLIRFADDFIMGFQYETDAKRLMEVLPKRFNRFKLDLHPEKTKLIPFGKPPQNGKPKGTFDFLGFTFYWGKSLKGYWVIKKQTARKRRNRFMRMLWSWCKKNRHESLNEQHETLCSKLRGFYQYFGVRSNYKALEVVYEYAMKAWRRWLGECHRDGYITHEKFRKILKTFPLPLPRIVHNI
ncbi:Retron-type RNA-directed DNA polymerase (EC [Olavius sp. associated proteobacterium Delta 1]|nr:Retron-type RNA-directed DNA polymerase (EC [Olavius sp. associated proteobacterium Delta 1]